MNNKTLIKINLEFAIIVSITLLVLGMNFYNQYGEKISFIIGQINYWGIIVVAMTILGLAMVYNLRIYWQFLHIYYITKTFK